ncbi:MAG: exosortase system-associated protein, TIGR04073 family [Candidatus Omnitrophica bacterium]|nr:exosortase system-associated protein, TIGR04073 family [Candidatus Omnitrophota bacterium]
MKNQRIVVVLMLSLILVGLAGPVWAGAGEPETGSLVVTKLFRGIVNAATGWMEIPKQTSLIWQDQGPGPGLSWGLVKGFGYAIGRSVVGAYEIVTFPFPIPEGYQPIMRPDYVMSDMGQSNK